jgi:hypothetical protein
MMSKYPEWMHEEFAEMIDLKGARITQIDGPKIEFMAEANLVIEKPQKIMRIKNIVVKKR